MPLGGRPLNRKYEVGTVWLLQAFLDKQNMHTKTRDCPP